MSSQNLILAPSPTNHLYPNLTALAAHINPFQNLEVFRSGLQKMFGLQVLYFASIKFFHSLLSPLMYLLTQDASRQRLTSLSRGIPSPPNFFGMQTKFQFARWSFLFSFVSFQRQCDICALMRSRAHLGNLKKESK